jgi:hypothetical protein
MKKKDADEDLHIQVLLRECEFCTIDANHLEDSIWAATGILVTASIAGMGFLSSSASQDMYGLVVRLIIAVVSIFIVWIWYNIVRRWYSIQQVMYYRTEEIEKELGMLKNRYVKALDDHIERKAVSYGNPQMFTLLTEMSADYRGRTVRRSIGFIKWGLILVWLAFGILQILILFFRLK